MKKEKKNFLVLGLGYFGAELAKKLYELGADVIAVDQDSQIVASLANEVTQAIEMNPADEEALKTLGISDYTACIIARGSNLEDSISIAATLKEEKAKKIIARAVSKKHGNILEKLGVDKVIFPEIEIADSVAEQLVSSNLFDKIILSETQKEKNELTADYVIKLFKITENIGMNVESYIKKMPMGTKLIAIHRKTENGEQKIITSFADEEFAPGDLILVWGQELRVHSLEQ